MIYSSDIFEAMFSRVITDLSSFWIGMMVFSSRSCKFSLLRNDVQRRVSSQSNMITKEGEKGGNLRYMTWLVWALVQFQSVFVRVVLWWTSGKGSSS